MGNDYEVLVQQETTAAMTWLEQAKSIIVNDPKIAQEVSDLRRQIKAKYKAIEDERKAQTGPLDAAKKRIMDFFRRPLDILDDADRALGAKLLAWDQAERKRVAEEEARLRAEAAERERRERERLEARAVKAETQGKTEKAEELRAQADQVSVPAPILAPAAKPQGFSTRTTWKAEIVDLRLLCQAIGARVQPVELVQPNMPALNKLATALKSGMNVPGVKAVSEEIAVQK